MSARSAAGPAAPAGTGARVEEPLDLSTVPSQSVLRALSATTNGVSIADMTRPDHPLVFVNPAFEALAGFPASELIGRNCRMLQGSDTDRAAVARIRAAIRAGVECRELVLNVRGPHREPWWNEVHLSPVHDEHGRLVQYVGLQNDVTDRVEADRALKRASDQARSYLARIEQLAYTDALTGLMNRRRFEEQVEVALWDARVADGALAVLFMDLDGFKAVNDELGHAAGDEVLQAIAARLRDRVRRTDLLARLGGDEFLVALCGLDPATAEQEARRIAAGLAECVREPVEVRGVRWRSG